MRLVDNYTLDLKQSQVFQASYECYIYLLKQHCVCNTYSVCILTAFAVIKSSTLSTLSGLEYMMVNTFSASPGFTFELASFNSSLNILKHKLIINIFVHLYMVNKKTKYTAHIIKTSCLFILLYVNVLEYFCPSFTDVYY